jgi:hypothetical protein
VLTPGGPSVLYALGAASAGLAMGASQDVWMADAGAGFVFRVGR